MEYLLIENKITLKNKFFFKFLQNFKTKKKKKTCHDMCIWMFSITLLHFERMTWIFASMIGAIIIFGENNFIFSLVIIDWWQSQLGKENKMPKDEC